MEEILSGIAKGVGIAGGAGFRAFIPLLIINILARFNYLSLQSNFQWLTSDWMLVILSALTLAEILLDKVPPLDNFIDAFQIFARPISGTVAAASLLNYANPISNWITGLIIALIISFPFHVFKSSGRMIFSDSLPPYKNSLISLLEDIISIAISITAVLLPVVSFVMVAVLLIFILRAIKNLQTRLISE